MTFSGKSRKVLLGAGVFAAAALSFSTARWATGSDHAGTTQSVKKPGIDFSDLHIFPDPKNPANVVFAMSVHPLIKAGEAAPRTVSFDTDVLYQFKIDTTGDHVEDLVIQARFEGTGVNQKVLISGPVKPSTLGTRNKFEKAYDVTGVINKPFSPTPGMRVFAGPRADPFFLDLVQLGNILPDRLAPPGLKPTQPPGEANTPRSTTFRGFPGQPAAVDTLANYNVLSIVVELPRTMLKNPATGAVGKIGVWETAGVKG